MKIDTYPLRTMSASTMTGIVKSTRLFTELASVSGFELLAAICIFMGLAFDSFDMLSFNPLPTTSGRMMVFNDI